MRNCRTNTFRKNEPILLVTFEQIFVCPPNCFGLLRPCTNLLDDSHHFISEEYRNRVSDTPILDGHTELNSSIERVKVWENSSYPKVLVELLLLVLCKTFFFGEGAL